MKAIAHIESPYGEKFGVPRQAGMVGVVSRVVFEPEYRAREAVRGLEEFDYIWLIWQFHQAEREGWHPTVRPPRLGGNARVGVFATRSPFRPNGLGLSAVRLISVDNECADAPVIYVQGADMVDGTPIVDIKPYLPYADSHPEARASFALQATDRNLDVSIGTAVLNVLPPHLVEPLRQTLACDPRPRYHDDTSRLYGLMFGGYNIRFTIADGVVTVVKAVKV